MSERSGSGPDECDDTERLIAANTRPWNSFWAWRDKPIAEQGAAREIMITAGLKVENLVSRQNLDPPDCEALVDGLWTGIEVTELVHRKMLERSLKAVKERAAGAEPNRPEAYFVWGKDDLISILQAQVDLKDAANLKGGPYERYILIIHTDEFFLDSESVERFLVGSSFRTSMITDAILGLSYEPRLGRCPTFRLTIGTK